MGAADSAKADKWSLAFKPGSSWAKDDLLDVVYWLRQWLGLVLGVVWGALALTGVGAMGAFLLVNLLAVVAYTAFLGIDTEDFGGPGTFATEGLGTSFATFLVSWTCTFTLLASESEYD